MTGRADSGAGLDLPFIVAALQGVLQLQLEQAAACQGTEVETVVAVGLAEHDELLESGSPGRLPSRAVVGAERRGPLGP